MKYVVLAFLFIISYYGSAINTDSLKLVVKTAKHDTIRCKALTELIEAENNPAMLFKYTMQLKNICEAKLNTISNTSAEYKRYQRFYSRAYNNEGYAYYRNGDFKNALVSYQKSLDLNKSIDDKPLTIETLNNLASVYFKLGNKQHELLYIGQALELAKQLKDNKLLAITLYNFGNYYQSIGEYNKALLSYQNCIKINQIIGNKASQIKALNNMAVIYNNKGDITKALKNYQESLYITRQLNDKTLEAYILTNMANIYTEQGDLNSALLYYTESLKINQMLGNKLITANGYIKIGKNIYQSKKDTATALAYYKKAHTIAQKVDSKTLIASVLKHIGEVYLDKNELNKAQQYLQQSISIYQTLSNKKGIAECFNNLGKVYQLQGNTNKAIDAYQKSQVLGQQIGIPVVIRDASKQLFTLHKQQGNASLALQNHELYVKMRDSIANRENQKAIIKTQYQIQYEKKAIADSINTLQEKKIVATKLENEKTKQYALFGIIALAVIFGAFTYSRFKMTQKQKNTIEQKEKETQLQKHIIEQKHKEIKDSINYAERIQRSFLATKQLLDENLKDYFILYKPKDVISGDFYWATTLHGFNDASGGFLLCTADSTGHGVPGAIMSLLNINSIEKACLMHNNPAEILNETRNIIIDRLKNDGSNDGGKDGMDCSLCLYNFENKTLKIAAANNAVWIVRKLNSNSAMGGNAITQRTEVEVIEIKPDKMPLGKHDKQNASFTLHEIQLQKGDVVYTLTDGFPDQFGGNKGKKFMSKNLRELLASNAHLPMADQKNLLEHTFKNWIGNNEQTDDVTLIGVRIA